MSTTSIFAYFILAASVLYVFAYPAYQEISILSSEQDKYEDYLAKAINVETQTKKLKAEFDNIKEADKQNINTVLPSSLNFVKLISDIDILASKGGIKIDRITSREVDSSVGTSIADAQPDKIYKSAVIGFSFATTYDNFNKFMAELEKSLRILDIRSVKITGANAANLYTYSVEFEVYWLKS